MLATEPQNHNHEASEYIWIVFSLLFSLLLLLPKDVFSFCFRSVRYSSSLRDSTFLKGLASYVY